MTLDSFIMKMLPRRRERIHFSAEYMYVAGVRMWELGIGRMEDQSEDIRQRIGEELNKK